MMSATGMNHGLSDQNAFLMKPVNWYHHVISIGKGIVILTWVLIQQNISYIHPFNVEYIG